MKKLSTAIVVVLLITLATLASTALKAQEATAKFFIEAANTGNIGTTTESNVDKEAINPNAVRHYEKKFKTATNAKWLTMKDGYTAKFISNDITERVFYNPNGTLAGTLKGYTAEKLPEEIHRIIKGNYNGYAITYVDKAEIMKLPGITVYIAHLQGYSDIKVVRICDGEMDVVFGSAKDATLPKRF